MKKIKLALLVLGASLFAGCSGDAVENTNERDTASKLTVIVRDAITGELVDGAQVSLLPSGPVVAKGGKASFDDVRMGTQSLKVEKTGYASVNTVASEATNNIEVNGTEGEYIFSASERSITVNLYPETASLYGYVFYTSAKGQTLPAEGAKIYVEFTDNSLINKLFEKQIDANGKYSFDSLPAGATGKVWAVVPEGGLGGIAFERCDIAASKKLVVGSNYAGDAKFSNNAANFEAFFGSTVAKDGDIEFTFTEAIDQSSIKIGSSPTVKVTPDGKSALKWDWESNKLTISLLPLQEWESDVSVAFSNLKSASGKTFSSTITISLGQKNLSSAAVDGVAIVPQPEGFNYDATTVNLRWNLVEGATAYEIYRKYDKDAGYVLAAEVKATPGATIGSLDNVDLDGSLQGRTVSFIVRAKNSTSISPLNFTNTADSIRVANVKDNVNPTLVSNSGECLEFSEPISISALSIDPLTKIEESNDEKTKICIAPAVEAATHYVVSGIADQAGNKFGSDGKATITVTP